MCKSTMVRTHSNNIHNDKCSAIPIIAKIGFSMTALQIREKNHLTLEISWYCCWLFRKYRRYSNSSIRLQKNHLTQKELGIALGFPEDSADVRIAQYETDTRKPRDEILVKMAKTLNVPLDILTIPVLSEPKEYEAASFWMHELAAEL